MKSSKQGHQFGAYPRDNVLTSIISVEEPKGDAASWAVRSVPCIIRNPSPTQESPQATRVTHNIFAICYGRAYGSQGDMAAGRFLDDQKGAELLRSF